MCGIQTRSAHRYRGATELRSMAARGTTTGRRGSRPRVFHCSAGRPCEILAAAQEPVPVEDAQEAHGRGAVADDGTREPVCRCCPERTRCVLAERGLRRRLSGGRPGSGNAARRLRGSPTGAARVRAAGSGEGRSSCTQVVRPAGRHGGGAPDVVCAARGGRRSASKLPCTKCCGGAPRGGTPRPRTGDFIRAMGHRIPAYARSSRSPSSTQAIT